jgi:hypothetical protein
MVGSRNCSLEGKQDALEEGVAGESGAARWPQKRIYEKSLDVSFGQSWRVTKGSNSTITFRFTFRLRFIFRILETSH